MHNSVIGLVHAGTLQTGSQLVATIWAAVGTVIVFGAVVYIIFKFFIGQGKNVGGGVAALVGVAVMAALAASPQIVMDLGTQLTNLVGL